MLGVTYTEINWNSIYSSNDVVKCIETFLKLFSELVNRKCIGNNNRNLNKAKTKSMAKW